MDIPAIVEAIAPGHDGHVSNIALDSEVLEQHDGTGRVCARIISYNQITVTIDLMSRTPDVEWTGDDDE